MKRKLKRLQKPLEDYMYIMHPSTRKELSPFVFFNSGTLEVDGDFKVEMHPHSGIGIITYFEGGNLRHRNTSGSDAVIDSGGVQWINTGGGTFHEEHHRKNLGTKGTWSLSMYQLWMQLPPELEEGKVEYKSFQPEDFPIDDNVKIIAGNYNGVQSPLSTPYNMTYLEVSLASGKQFDFQTPTKQTTGFIYIISGESNLHGEELSSEKLNILEHNEGQITINAITDTKLLLIIGEPQNYPIYTQWGSIHTNELSMARSMDRIRKISYS